MPTSNKDTIYIDIDDEITGIIDKLHGSNSKVVALVLPKRATVLQSVVNMKLLKRAADADKKNLVLITSEAGLLPLAGVAGVHVAKTINSKPEIPASPEAFDDTEETVGEDDTVEDEEVDPNKPIGVLAGVAAGAAVGAAAAGAASGSTAAASSASGAGDDGLETLVMDDDGTAPEDVPEDTPTRANTTTKPKDKKLAVPNFERFRLVLALVLLAVILLIGGFIYASVSLPKATILIKTNATNVDTNSNLILSTSATSLDTSNNTLPAKQVSQQKTYSQQVPTTGQKNNGNKASGTISMTATICGSIQQPGDVPAGTGVSANGQTYITQQDTSFGSPNIKKGCLYFQATSNTPILAQTGGASYNIPGNSSFTIAGRSDVSATGSAQGGTDSIVQSVNQNDINNAKAKINTDDASVKSALESQLQQGGYYALPATYSAGTPTVTSSANVGEVANNVTVTETVNYTMFGVNQSDLNTVINNNIKGQIDTSKQAILDNGLSAGVFNVNNLTSTGAQVTLSTKAVVGPDLNVDTIKQQSAGKRAGDIKSQLSNNPDVVSVTVKISPFWISGAPKDIKRITVIIAKPTTTAKSSSNASTP